MGKEIYTAALIIIGDEILSGRTQDLNTSYIAKKLNDSGVRLIEVRVIPDKGDMIIATVNELRANHDYVFTTGGIGPTHDDITAENIAKAFGVEIVLHPEAYAILLGYYKNESDITPARKKMAMIPAGANLIQNPVSGAPGIHIGNVYVMAGVPHIMQAMFDSIVPTLIGGKPMLSRSVTAELAESVIAQGLEEIQNRYMMLSIGSYPKYMNGRFGTALVLRGTDEDILAKATLEVAELAITCGDAKPVVE